jgi:geranylgeranyl diphosphate synthase, type II
MTPMDTDQNRIDVVGVLRGRAARVERGLSSFLDRLSGAPLRLVEAIRYSLLAGGKRLRPALVLEWHAALIGSHEPNASAVAAAMAIELIHTFSLVHDDLPAMDDDDLRRGAPTNHKVFGEAMAILAGDAMTAMAFETLAADADPRHAAKMAAELARATGPLGMIGGQVVDIANENVDLSLDALRSLHTMKTGALLTAACRLGAIAADANAATLECATSYGRHLGLAFQIMDDVLDVTATPQQMGKATGKDADAGKNTYPKLLGLEESRSLARRELDQAIEAISGIPCGATLAALARFVVERAS